MKMHEMLSESKVTEAPMGMIQRGVQGLKSMVPGSIGQKATGSLETGKAANQLYKEYNTYLGRTGQEMSQQSLVAFLKSAGIPTKIINSAAGVAPAKRTKAAPAAAPTPAAPTPRRRTATPAPAAGTPPAPAAAARGRKRQATPELAAPPAPAPAAAAFGKNQVNAILMKVAQALGGAAPQASPAAAPSAPATPAPAAPSAPAAPAPAAGPSAASRVGSAVVKGAKAVGNAAVKGAKAVGNAVSGGAAPAAPKVGAKQVKAQIDQAVNNIQGIRTRDRANVVNYAKQKVNALTESAMLNDIKKLAGLK